MGWAVTQLGAVPSMGVREGLASMSEPWAVMMAQRGGPPGGLGVPWL